MKSVVIYASTTGNTKAVAEYIASQTNGTAVDVKSAKPLDLDGCDTVIFGSRVHAGKISKHIIEFVNENRSRMKGMKQAFFICCTFKEQKAEEQVANIAQILGISKATYFNKGKALAQDGAEIDDFLAHI